MTEHDVFRISESGELKGPSTSTVRLWAFPKAVNFLMYFNYPVMVHKSLSMKVLVCGFDWERLIGMLFLHISESVELEWAPTFM